MSTISGFDIQNLDIQKLDVETAKTKVSEYAHSLIRQYSSVRFDPLFDKIDWDEVEEAFFFDEKKELHFFRREDSLDAVEAKELDAVEHVVDREYELASVFHFKNGRIKVREYLVFDEDGQCRVGFTRLIGFEKGAES